MKIRILRESWEDAENDEGAELNLKNAIATLRKVGEFDSERKVWITEDKNIMKTLDRLGIKYKIVENESPEEQPSEPILTQLQEIQERLKRIEQRIESMTPLNVPEEKDSIEYSRPYDFLLNMVKENPAVADIAEISNLPDRMRKSINSIASNSLNQKEKLSDDEVKRVRFLVHMILSQLSFEDDIRIQEKIDKHFDEYIDFLDKKGLGGMKTSYKNWSVPLKDEFLEWVANKGGPE
ncbi:hypothetical protein [Thermofilum sp.]|uniref:hypothetical protein n=1 Tax=Thermofilum sp. TaxID=1961369 RepID=UPI00317DAB9A